ncbi:MAG TPA: transposase [Gemmatimonadales bacterium]
MRVDMRLARCRRRSVRLWEYDYRRDGAYFVTICTHARTPLFGSIVNAHVRLSDAGTWARDCWYAIPRHFPQVSLDRFVIMPDHVHGIIVIQNRDADSGPVGPMSNGTDNVGARHVVPLHTHDSVRRTFGRGIRGSLATIVGTFKSAVTRYMKDNGMTGRVWQRNYYEHVIRNDGDLYAIRRYIVTNPERWNKRSPKRT